jgi:hypothetical protein
MTNLVEVTCCDDSRIFVFGKYVLYLARQSICRFSHQHKRLLL